MTRTIISIALAVLVILSTAAYADASDKKQGDGKKGHVSMGTIVFTKHYDKASPYLN